MNQLTFTVDTHNVLVLKEVASMLTRLAETDHAGLLKYEEVETPTVNPVEAFGEDNTPPSVNPVTELELDSAGMPWDERIHASTKSKVKDGTWTFKRGLDEATKQAVLAEYGVAVGNDDTSATQNSAPTVTQSAAPTEQTPPPPPVMEQTPPPPPVMEQTPPPVTESTEITTFAQILPAIRAKGIDPKDAIAVAQSLGVSNIIGFNMPENQHLIPDFVLALGL